MPNVTEVELFVAVVGTSDPSEQYEVIAPEILNPQVMLSFQQSRKNMVTISIVDSNSPVEEIIQMSPRTARRFFKFLEWQVNDNYLKF
jgi:hypothetical protein